jgi:hypothetical protein
MSLLALLARSLACAVALVVGLSGAQSAQTPSGEIVGKVTESTGGVLPGVTITVSGSGLAQPAIAVTGRDGAFRFTAVPAGSCEITAVIAGFKKATVQVVVGSGARTDVGTISLMIGDIVTPNLTAMGLKRDDSVVVFKTSRGRVDFAIEPSRDAVLADRFLAAIKAKVYSGGRITPVARPGLPWLRIEMNAAQRSERFVVVLLENDMLASEDGRTVFGHVWTYFRANQDDLPNTLRHALMSGGAFDPPVTIESAGLTLFLDALNASSTRVRQ